MADEPTPVQAAEGGSPRDTAMQEQSTSRKRRQSSPAEEDSVKRARVDEHDTPQAEQANQDHADQIPTITSAAEEQASNATRTQTSPGPAQPASPPEPTSNVEAAATVELASNLEQTSITESAPTTEGASNPEQSSITEPVSKAEPSHHTDPASSVPPGSATQPASLAHTAPRPSQSDANAPKSTTSQRPARARRPVPAADLKRRMLGSINTIIGTQIDSEKLKRRREIEKAQKEKLVAEAQKMAQETARLRQDRQRLKERKGWEKRRQMLCRKHADLIKKAAFLRTGASPMLYYKPYQPNDVQEQRISQQVREAEEKRDGDLEAFDNEFRNWVDWEARTPYNSDTGQSPIERRHSLDEDEQGEPISHTDSNANARLNSPEQDEAERSVLEEHHGGTLVEGEEDAAIY